MALYGNRQPAPLKEPLLSRRRMRPLVILIAVPVLIISLVVALYFNQDVERQSLSDDIVKAMLEASRYRAAGIEIIDGAREVREQFEYVAPNNIHSMYLTVTRDGGFGSLPSECAENEVVMIGSSGYQRCISKGEDWNTFSPDTTIFNRLSFQPWRRLEWCTTFTEEQTRVIAGEEIKILSCAVPPEREAEADYGTDDSEKKQRFIAEATIEITAWIRESDGFISRFAMTKTLPGSTTQTLDYSYSEFDSIEQIRPPDTTAPDTATVAAPDIGPSGQPSSQSSAPQLSQPPETTAATSFIDLYSGDNTPERAIIDGNTIILEVANDSNSRTQGLSRRQLLAENAGMLFVFPTEGFQKFWMKEVRFPLDLLFISADGIIVDIQKMDTEPGVLDADLVIYESPVPVPLALEILGGKASELGLEVGTLVEFE
mgnify:CR=1 FL=1